MSTEVSHTAWIRNVGRMLKLIPLRGSILILALSLSACASLPKKSDVAIGKERFAYAFREPASQQ